VSNVGSRISKLLNPYWSSSKVGKLSFMIFDDDDDAELDIDGDNVADFIRPPPQWIFWTKGVVHWVIGLFCMELIAAALFCAVEPKVDYGDALYHCIVTASTVGYGDVPIHSQGGRLLAFFHIACSVTWLASFISHVESLHGTRRMQLQKEAMLERQLDKELLHKLDKDGKGVDKLEFVIGMLINLGVELCGAPLEWDDVRPFLLLFKKNDVDGNGVLTGSDLAKLVEVRQQKVEDRIQKVRSAKSSSLTKAHPISE